MSDIFILSSQHSYLSLFISFVQTVSRYFSLRLSLFRFFLFVSLFSTLIPFRFIIIIFSVMSIFFFLDSFSFYSFALCVPDIVLGQMNISAISLFLALAVDHYDYFWLSVYIFSITCLVSCLFSSLFSSSFSSSC